MTEHHGWVHRLRRSRCPRRSASGFPLPCRHLPWYRFGMVALAQPRSRKRPRSCPQRRVWRPKSDLPRSTTARSGYRFYSPKLGRWVNRDPVGETGGVNLCGFVRNEPASGVDALGLEVTVVRVPVPSGLPAGARAGYTVPSVPVITMSVDEDNSGSSCCWRLKLMSDSSTIEWWATHEEIVPHEQLHVSDFTYYHNRTKLYAQEKERCYSSKAKAECWKRAASGRAPLFYYWTGLYISTLVRDGFDKPDYGANRDAARWRLDVIESICDSL